MRAPAPNRLLRAWCAASLAASCALAQAQVTAPPSRVYPMGSLAGYANFGAGPSLQVNCVSYPLGPGLRVQNVQQRLVLRGQLAGLHGPAVFARDATGNVFQVWMLAPGQSATGVPAAPNRCLFQQY